MSECLDDIVLLDAEQLARLFSIGRHKIDFRIRRGTMPVPDFAVGHNGRPAWRVHRLGELAAALGVPAPPGGWSVFIHPRFHASGGPRVDVIAHSCPA